MSWQQRINCFCPVSGSAVTVHDDFELLDDDRPTLPRDGDIINMCRAAHQANMARLATSSLASISGVKIVEPTSGRAFWVKFGPTITLTEARTQHYVAKQISMYNASAGPAGKAPVRVPAVYRVLKTTYKHYIVMEFIDGRVCSQTMTDAKAVGTALSFLFANIPVPQEQRGCPGPPGGGLICHNFFVDRKSAVQYPSVDVLAAHINGVRVLLLLYTAGTYYCSSPSAQILKKEKSKDKVDFGPEVMEHGLRFCTSDLTAGNFMRAVGDNEMIVVIDFEAWCFLPISFFQMALGYPDSFTRLIRPFVERPEARQTQAIELASSFLVKYQSNMIGERHLSLLAFLLSFSLASSSFSR